MNNEFIEKLASVATKYASDAEDLAASQEASAYANQYPELINELRKAKNDANVWGPEAVFTGPKTDSSMGRTGAIIGAGVLGSKYLDRANEASVYSPTLLGGGKARWNAAFGGEASSLLNKAKDGKYTTSDFLESVRGKLGRKINGGSSPEDIAKAFTADLNKGKKFNVGWGETILPFGNKRRMSAAEISALDDAFPRSFNPWEHLKAVGNKLSKNLYSQQALDQVPELYAGVGKGLATKEKIESLLSALEHKGFLRGSTRRLFGGLGAAAAAYGTLKGWDSWANPGRGSEPTVSRAAVDIHNKANIPARAAAEAAKTRMDNQDAVAKAQDKKPNDNSLLKWLLPLGALGVPLAYGGYKLHQKKKKEKEEGNATE